LRKLIRIKQYWFLLPILIILIIGYTLFSNKLTYLEYEDFNSKFESYVPVNSSGVNLQQSFKMPYNLFYGIEIQFATFAHDNNSDWVITLRNTSDNKNVYQWILNASELEDNNYHSFNVKSPISVNKNATYELILYSTNCDENSGLAIACSTIDNTIDGVLTVSDVKMGSNLCLKIQGGDKDAFWSVIYVLLSIYLLFLISYCSYLAYNKKSILKNEIACVLIMFLFYFILLSVYANNVIFTDEDDNIRGGLIIAKGGILYKDYYVQHTPFAYYLCALFALLGASSIEQFRILYFLSISICWSLIYLRYKNNFGKETMIILPILQIILSAVLFPPHQYMILSDNIQGICMVVLLLEFLCFAKDRIIDTKRTIIISVCIFLSIASAFVSIYAISIITIGVFIIEIFNSGLHRNPIKFINKLFLKYYKLFIAILVPFILVGIYLTSNNILIIAYKMAYRFNTDVYSNYTSGFGNDKIQPFFIALKSFFELFVNAFNSLINGEVTATILLQTILLIILLIFVYDQFKENHIISFIIFFFACCCATRGNTNFHSIPFWNVLILVLALMIGNYMINFRNNKKMVVILVVALVYFCQPYITTLESNIFRKPSLVSETEHKIVQLAQDNEKIFIDTYVCDSIYLIYKNHYPVNRNCYLLPWYMDWYELDTIEDIKNSQPIITIYNPDTIVWDYQYFAIRLDSYIKTNYTRLVDGSVIWIRNDQINNYSD